MSHQVTSADGTEIALEQVTDGPRPLVTLAGATAGRELWAEAARGLDGRVRGVARRPAREGRLGRHAALLLRA